MFTIKVTSSFHAGHQIKFAKTAEPYHIHDWLVEAAVAGKTLDENGLLFDFVKFKRIIEEIISPFDDKALEDFDYFKGVNTSAENVAKYIFDTIKKQLPPSVTLLYIEVTEAHGCKARFSENLSL